VSNLYVLFRRLGQHLHEFGRLELDGPRHAHGQFPLWRSPGPDNWIASGKNGTLLRPDRRRLLEHCAHRNDQLALPGPPRRRPVCCRWPKWALYTSADGTNWAQRASGTTRWLNDVTFVDGRWFVVGTQGLLLSSSNLVNWTSLTVPSIKSLYGAGNLRGQLVLTASKHHLPQPGRAADNACETFSRITGVWRPIPPATTNALVSAYELFLLGGLPDQFSSSSPPRI